MSALILQADAGRLPLPDGSVNLVVTSSPYFAQRLYFDRGQVIPGQTGAEPTAEEFLEACWVVMRELWRVLAPDGSVWWNLGDKRAGSGAPGTTSGLSGRRPSGTPVGLPGAAMPYEDERRIGATTLEGTHPRKRAVQGDRSGIAGGYTKEGFGRDKSKMLLPHRFAIGCEDGLADPDGIGWIVRQDQVWEKPNGLPESVKDRTVDKHEYWFHLTKNGDYHADLTDIRTPPKGKADGATFGGKRRHSVQVVGSARAGHSTYDEAKPAMPRSVWSIATEQLVEPEHLNVEHTAAFPSEWPRRLILGWSRPGDVVLDPFGGSGTTAMVAHALGRRAIHVDLGHDYGRLARWRVHDSDGPTKVRTRTNTAAQPDLFGATA